MSLYRRGDVWHYDFTIDGERFRGSTQQLSKTAARKVEADARERALGPAHVQIPTLREAARQWFISRAEGRRSVQTIAQRVKIMLPLVGPDKLVTEIGTPDVEAAVQARRLHTTRQGKTPTNATVNRDIIDTTLRPILAYCRRILELPVREIAWQDVKLPEPKERDRKFTAAEIEAWREALPDWHRQVFDFAKRYGVRLKEAFFPPGNYDPADGRVILRWRKGGKPHVIRLLPEDRATMTARYGRAVALSFDTVWIKEGKNGPEPIHWRGFQSASREALDAAGIADARPVHDLRHHAGNELYRRSGGNLPAVKTMLGHEHISSTMRYVQADDEDVFDALSHAYGTREVSDENLINGDNGLPGRATGT